MILSNTRPVSISVFFPCYNDAEIIGKLVADADSVLKKISKDYEIIIVNDGSTDETENVLESLRKKYPFRLVVHKKNLGYGAALKSGFRASTKKLVFYTDGDGQYDVKELPLLVSIMTKNVNFVNGIKMKRQDKPYRIFLGNLYKFFVRFTFWLPIYDPDCDFRLIRKGLLNKISLKSDSGSICIELVKKAQRAGGVFRQVSVHHFERKYGKSQFFRPLPLLRTFKELIPLWINLIIIKRLKKN